MKKIWLHKNGKENLIIFATGWGMDEHPFNHLASDNFDVLMCYDYSSVAPSSSLDNLLKQYASIYLIGWSMGVWAGQKLFAGKKESFTRTIAINGTLCPVHDDFGIPIKIFDATLTTLTKETRHKFYRRMCREKTNFKFFLSRQPQRDLDDQRRELAALSTMVDCLPAEQSIYEEIIISDYDWIVPTANLLRYWQGHTMTRVPGFHYLFNLWQSWDHLLLSETAPRIAVDGDEIK